MGSTRNKVNIYAVPDLKNATDDEISRIMTSQGYTQKFTLIDIRLALGFSSVIVAAAASYYDFKVGFEAAKKYTAIGVTVYFVLNALLTLWIWKGEKGTVYEGVKDDVKISLQSSATKHVAVYKVEVKNGRTGKKVEGWKPFTEFFDSEGYLVPEPLERWLETVLEDAREEGAETRKSK
ncbi:signal peptidase complex subunit 2 [Myxozyma melibiosi]|uniref:Signal peptidase complex subunit 2 n=1 Tax=Myxozyma melibiosi TaxID=54550 RepID=A0ABR1F426_9ASCO